MRRSTAEFRVIALRVALAWRNIGGIGRLVEDLDSLTLRIRKQALAAKPIVYRSLRRTVLEMQDWPALFMRELVPRAG